LWPKWSTEKKRQPVSSAAQPLQRKDIATGATPPGYQKTSERFQVGWIGSQVLQEAALKHWLQKTSKEQKTGVLQAGRTAMYIYIIQQLMRREDAFEFQQK